VVIVAYIELGLFILPQFPFLETFPFICGTGYSWAALPRVARL